MFYKFCIEHLLSLRGSFDQICITSWQNEHLPQLMYYLPEISAALRKSAK